MDVILTPIYEEEFLGISYGFRPGKGAHSALDALAYGIRHRKVNWILDADIRAYFDTIDRRKLIKLLEKRIGDKRVIRLIQRWFKSGVLEDGAWSDSGLGTAQGAIISPILSNIYLHYVLDLWFHHWRRQARGDVIMIRYADDYVVGFQLKRVWLKALRRRSQKDKFSWANLQRITDSTWPKPTILHPWPEQRFAERHNLR